MRYATGGSGRRGSALQCVIGAGVCPPIRPPSSVALCLAESPTNTSLMPTKAFLKSRDERKRVEMRFAHLKTHHGFERLRLRGLTGARVFGCPGFGVTASAAQARSGDNDH